MSGPTYRFWGRRNPEGRVKPRIVAEAPGGAVGEDGTAVVRLYDPVDSWGGYWGVSAREFLETLDGLSDAKTIELHINSPGGEVYEAIAILNALRQHPARVVAIVDGLAASAASFIAAGADELVMGRNTELMVHDAWGVGIGPAATMRELADMLDRISDNIASIYAEKAGTPTAGWREVMLAETWFSAAEAVEAGLADRVDSPAGEGDGGASASWDLSIFNRPGRQAASAPVIQPKQQQFDVSNVIEALRGAFA